MGHVVSKPSPYRLLQERLDRNVTGAPSSPAFTKILQLLYSAEEAEIARHIPPTPTALDKLAKKLGIPAPLLGEKLRAMAERGAMMDLKYQGTHYFALPPVVIGLFEFTFMRVHPDVPLDQLAPLFDEYAWGNSRFIESAFGASTQVGRALLRDEALPEGTLGDHSEVLDWERAAGIIEGASSISVSPCSCRHEADHLGKACDRPQRTCLTLDYAADYMVGIGAGERLSAQEALRVIEECEDAGMAHIADNVQRKVHYLCNCCGCCCGMIRAATTFELDHAIVTSNWVPVVDEAACTGCAKCVKACPLGAFVLVERENGETRRKLAVRDADLCIGCGVCHRSCAKDALRFERRPQRAYTPETIFDRVVSMAIERQKLGGLLFPDRDKLSHRAFGRVIDAIERSSPAKAALAIEPLNSAFLSTMVKAAKMTTGPIKEVMQ